MKESIDVLALMSNDYQYMPEDSPENMLKFAIDHQFNFPYLVDKNQSIGKAYNAVCTPDFFELNRTDKANYNTRGRLDDARRDNLAN